MGDQTTTQQNTIGPQTPEAQQLLQLIARLAGQSEQQLGDLSSLASGNFAATDSDRALAESTANTAAEIARQNAGRDYEMTSRQTEDTLVGRGVDSSTIDAVTQALQGRQYQQQLGQIGLQQQDQTAQMLAQLPFQRAGAQISANQAILQRILGGSQGMLDYDIRARLGSGTAERTSPFDWSGAAQGVGMSAAAL